MIQETKLPLGEGSIAQQLQTHSKHSNKQIGKLDRMLSVFASGISLNTFQAKELGDTCLHTTISSLQAKHLLSFKRKREEIRNRFGTTTRVMRYWLEGEQLEKAQAVINARRSS